MDNKGFLPDLYRSAVEFNEISYEMFEFYRELLGTPVTVTRIIEDKRSTVLSATLTSTFQDNDRITQFNWKVILNQSSMMGIWRRNVNQLEIYDVVDKLKSGDLLRFEYLGIIYQFKVTSTQSYGIGKNIVFQYTLNPIIEHYA